MTPKISIIIPCRRGSRSTEVFLPLLQSCKNQTIQNFELLWISDGPDAELGEAISKNFSGDSRFIFFETSSTGVNHARHFGATKAKGEIFYFLDDDCELPNQFILDQLIDFHEKMGPGSIFGGCYLDNPRLKKQSGYNQFVDAWLQCGKIYPAEGLGERAWSATNLVGGNFSIRPKQYFSRPFNTEVLLFGDETEFFRSQRTFGAKLLLIQSLAVFHADTGGWKKLFKRAWQSGKQRERLNLKTDIGLVDRLRIIFRSVYQKKSLIIFFAAHFSVLYVSVFAQKLKKLSSAVGEVGAAKEESNSY